MLGVGGVEPGAVSAFGIIGDAGQDRGRERRKMGARVEAMGVAEGRVRGRLVVSARGSCWD